MSTSRRYRALVGVLLYALAVTLAVRLETRTETGAAAAYHSLYLPSGRYLKWASLGCTTLMSDLLYIWSIQYYFVEREDQFHHLARFYDVVTDLDPRYLEAYDIGSLTLAWSAGHAKEGLALLDKGVRANPRDWSIAFEAGYYARQYLGDKKTSLRYLEEATKRPGAPKYVSRWYYSTLAATGQAAPAELLAFWHGVRDNASSVYEKDAANRHIEDITNRIQLDLVRQALARFKAAKGNWPVTLEDLVRGGQLGAVPDTPDGQPYQYDHLTGTVANPPGYRALK